jgi:protein-S-isoprenylcysteine O-methyltransferase Ste14
VDYVYALLIPLLWLAWCAYWLFAASNVKSTTREESPGSRAGHIVPLVIAGMLLWLPRVPFAFFDDTIIPRTPALYFIGAAVVAAGLLFAVWARLYLGRNWSGTVTLKQDHELIRSGPYRYVRHPIYTGLLIAFVGSAIARDQWRGVIAVVIVYLALWRKLRLEERWMIETFGDAYRRFRAEVPALVPSPFRRRSSAKNP